MDSTDDHGQDYTILPGVIEVTLNQKPLPIQINSLKKSSFSLVSFQQKKITNVDNLVHITTTTKILPQKSNR